MEDSNLHGEGYGDYDPNANAFRYHIANPLNGQLQLWPMNNNGHHDQTVHPDMVQDTSADDASALAHSASNSGNVATTGAGWPNMYNHVYPHRFDLSNGLNQSYQLPTRPAALMNANANVRPVMYGNWAFNNPQMSQQTFARNSFAQQQFNNQYFNNMQPSNMQPTTAEEFIPFTQPHPSAMSDNDVMMTTGEETHHNIPATAAIESYGPLGHYQNDLQNGLTDYPLAQPMVQAQPQPQANYGQNRFYGTTSPTEAGSPDSDGWQLIDNSVHGHYGPVNSSAVSNPGLTLHIRSGSNGSSHQEAAIPGSACSLNSKSSFEELQFGSPELDAVTLPGPSNVQRGAHQLTAADHSDGSNALVALPMSSSPSSSSEFIGSPPNDGSPVMRRKKDSPPKANAKPVGITKKTNGGNKKPGRRTGPLKPEQRVAAGEIRKCRACMRCRYLKKTCDKGTPCAGCQPAHARLWLVPCTRVDIKDLSYFMSDWDVDLSRHCTIGFTIANVKGYSPLERQVYVTHGFGIVLPVGAREIYVHDNDCFSIDWVETIHNPVQNFEKTTAGLCIGAEGVPYERISTYLDEHIDVDFERWLDHHFEGVGFLSDVLKTTYDYYSITKSPAVRTAIKFIVAYNLTQHVCLVEGVNEDDGLEGKIDDPKSKYFGKTISPVMLNFAVKEALAKTWRHLHKEVLKELNKLINGVYAGEKLKNWPTIFMLTAIVLAVWEEMEFDTYYRKPDRAKTFCHDLESVPVGVLQGMLSAISQKLPTFHEWNSEKHGEIFGRDKLTCDTMTALHGHVTKHCT